ncbi:hypothetical protein JOB18_048621 [Solea senegalensis]|uniref:Uncharacterized protein n=1 Tax=Solea senegalensis TaxID=28829 RepID=A0AAV6PW09_SOLSE|nr:hypothetical protein JOB18_048621 [Solea senegalensis]
MNNGGDPCSLSTPLPILFLSIVLLFLIFEDEMIEPLTEKEATNSESKGPCQQTSSINRAAAHQTHTDTPCCTLPTHNKTKDLDTGAKDERLFQSLHH